MRGRIGTTTGARRRVAPGRLATAVGGAAAAVALLAGCSSGDELATPAIPTFPGPGAAPATSAPAPRSTLVPTDCNQILSKDDLPNLGADEPLGIPEPLPLPLSDEAAATK